MIALGVVLGLVLVGGAIALGFLWPTKPLQRRNESDHSPWQDSAGVADRFPLDGPPP
jgi:hypothetical protein